MDLGIAGRKAIVCASSRGLGRACAMRLAEAGCEVTINGLDPKRLENTAEDIRKATKAQGHRGRGRRRHRRGPGQAVRRLPGAGHPDHQQRRAAVPRFPRARPREDDRRRDRQHGGADRADPARDRPDGEEQVRPHRQHHVGLGEDADRRPRPVVRRARGPDRVPRRRGALGRAAQRHDQLPAAGAVRHRPAALTTTRSPPRSRASPSSRPTADRAASVPAKRFGNPDEFGAACAFLCSSHAGFITGQNLLMDGGIFPGAF